MDKAVGLRVDTVETTLGRDDRVATHDRHRIIVGIGYSVVVGEKADLVEAAFRGIEAEAVHTLAEMGEPDVAVVVKLEETADVIIARDGSEVGPLRAVEPEEPEAVVSRCESEVGRTGHRNRRVCATHPGDLAEARARVVKETCVARGEDAVAAARHRPYLSLQQPGEGERLWRGREGVRGGVEPLVGAEEDAVAVEQRGVARADGVGIAGERADRGVEKCIVEPVVEAEPEV